MKPCIPRKNTDTNNIRAIIKNINNRCKTDWTNYKIDKNRYICLISALMSCGIVGDDVKKDKPTDEYIIIDVVKFEEWSRGDFYNKINQIVVPLVSAAVSLTSSFVTTQ